MRKLFTLWLFLLAVVIGAPNLYSAGANLVGAFNGWNKDGNWVTAENNQTVHRNISLGDDTKNEGQNWRFRVRVWDDTNNIEYHYNQNEVPIGVWTELTSSVIQDPYLYISGEDNQKYDVYFDLGTHKICVVKTGVTPPSQSDPVPPTPSSKYTAFRMWGDVGASNSWSGFNFDETETDVWVLHLDSFTGGGEFGFQYKSPTQTEWKWDLFSYDGSMPSFLSKPGNYKVGSTLKDVTITFNAASGKFTMTGVETWPYVYLAGYNGSWGTGGIRLTNNQDGTYSYVFPKGEEISTKNKWKLCYSNTEYIDLTSIYFNGVKQDISDTAPYVQLKSDDYYFTSSFDQDHETTFTFVAPSKGAKTGDLRLTCSDPDAHIGLGDNKVFLYGFKNNSWDDADALEFTETEPGIFELNLESIGDNYEWKIKDKIYTGYITLNDVATYVKGVYTDNYTTGYLIWGPDNMGNAKFNPERVRLDEPVKMIYNRNLGRLDVSLSIIGEIPEYGEDLGIYLLGDITSAKWTPTDDVNRFTYTGYGHYEFRIPKITAGKMKIRIGKDPDAGWQNFADLKIRVNGRSEIDHIKKYIVPESDAVNADYRFVVSNLVVDDGAILTYTPSNNALIINVTRQDFQVPNVTHIALKPNVGEQIHFSPKDGSDDVWVLDLGDIPFGYRFSFIRYFQGSPEPDTPELGEPDWTPLISDGGLPRYLLNDTRNNTYYTTAAFTGVVIEYDKTTNKFTFVGTPTINDDPDVEVLQNVMVRGYGREWDEDVVSLDKQQNDDLTYTGKFEYRFKELRDNEPFLLFDYNDGKYYGYESLDAASKLKVQAGEPVTITEEATDADGNTTASTRTITPIMFQSGPKDFVNVKYDEATHEINVAYYTADRSINRDFGTYLWVHWREKDATNNPWHVAELLLDKPDGNNPSGINCYTTTIYPEYEKIEFYLTNGEKPEEGDFFGNRDITLQPNIWRDNFVQDKYLSGTKYYQVENIEAGARYRVIVSPKTNSTAEGAKPTYSSVGVFPFPDESRPWGTVNLYLHSNLESEKWPELTDGNVTLSTAKLEYDAPSNTYSFGPFTAGPKQDFSPALKNAGVTGQGHQFTLTDANGIIWYKSNIDFPYGIWIPNALQIHTTNDNLDFHTTDLIEGQKYHFQLRYNDLSGDWEARFVKDISFDDVYIKAASLGEEPLKMNKLDNGFEYVKTFLVDNTGFDLSTHTGEQFNGNRLAYIGEPRGFRLETLHDYRYESLAPEATNTWYLRSADLEGYTGGRLVTVRVNTKTAQLTISSPTASVALANVKAVRAVEFDSEDYLLNTNDGSFTISGTDNYPGKVRHFNKIQGDLTLSVLSEAEGLEFKFVSLKIEGKDVDLPANLDFNSGEKDYKLKVDYLPYVPSNSKYNVVLKYRFKYTSPATHQVTETPIRTITVTRTSNFTSSFVRPMAIEQDMKVLYGKVTYPDGDKYTAMLSINGIDFGAVGNPKQVYRPSRHYQTSGKADAECSGLDAENLAAYIGYDFKIDSESVHADVLYKDKYSYIFNNDHLKDYKNDFIMEANADECWSQCAVNNGRLGVIIQTPYTSEAEMKNNLATDLKASIKVIYPVVSKNGGIADWSSEAPVSVAGRRAALRAAAPALNTMDNRAILLEREGNNPGVEALNDIVTGIEEVSVDYSAEDVEYYNLQGLRIAEPQKGQIVIRRQGNQTTKIRF